MSGAVGSCERSRSYAGALRPSLFSQKREKEERQGQQAELAHRRNVHRPRSEGGNLLKDFKRTSQVAGLFIGLRFRKPRQWMPSCKAALAQACSLGMIRRVTFLFFVNPFTKKRGQFLSSIPLSSQTARNVAASRLASVTSERSKTILESSSSISSLSVFKHSIHIRSHTKHNGILPADEPFNLEDHLASLFVPKRKRRPRFTSANASQIPFVNA
jgi:hypothetical protein